LLVDVSVVVHDRGPMHLHQLMMNSVVLKMVSESIAFVVVAVVVVVERIEKLP